MTTRPLPSRGPGPGPRLLLLALLAVAGALLSVGLDQRSPEHAQRLFRSGETARALEAFQELQGRTGQPEWESYQLGTARLTLGRGDARQPLEQATQGPLEVAAPASYNLALSLLADLPGAPTPDSAVALLDEVVRWNRAALRADPGFDAATWNLALAQYLLDSLGMRPLDPDFEVVAGDDETLIDLDALVRSDQGDGASGMEPETPTPAQATGERQAALQGAREAWALQDPGPLDRAVALSLLERVEDESEALIRGLLWAHRPDVAWWTNERYPGGDW